MAQHGGKRAGAGRKPGRVSKVKKDLASLAKDHAETALKTLVEIMTKGESETARLSAANALLDRGFGKPFQGSNPYDTPDPDDVPALNINITSDAPVRDVRVTRSEG